MHNLSLAVLSLIACSAHASVSSAAILSATTGVASSNATCPSRTVNYITHGLPQQCLTSSWRSAATSPAANSVTGLVSDGSPALSLAANANTVDSNPTETANSGRDLSAIAPASKETTSSRSESFSSTSAALASAPTVSDESSPLEDEKFLSFEEWKKQNLQKAGQSEHVGRDAQVERSVPRKRPTNIHTALDSLGDDAEIDLDFTGFIPDGPDLHTRDQQTRDPEQPVDIVDSSTTSSPNLSPRSKEAGTTSKDRYNYASFDCGALVRKHNSEASTASTVLGENKDSYMLNVCSADNKFLILELCSDISIDTIVVANFEFFSSTFRTFRVSVSDKYPVKLDKWKSLGTFEARNTRELQAFLVDNPVIWARYLRFEFLTHYGSEYYCPVSLVRVHGKTMMEEYKNDMESLQAEEEGTADEAETVDASDETLVPEAIADVILDERQREAQDAIQEAALGVNMSTEAGDCDSTPGMPLDQTVNTQTSSTSPAIQIDLSTMLAANTCPAPTPVAETSVHSGAALPTCSTAKLTERPVGTPSSSTISEVDKKKNSYGYKPAASAHNSTTSSPPLGSSVKAQNVTDASRVNSNTTSAERQKPPSTTTQSQAAAPTMQESFFKSVQKRLQMLEANSSLSLHYIEDQSRALRDAFNRVEQRQLAKTTTFLDYLNTTVLSELRDFRQQYDQLWQSTVIELDMQRERYQQETAAINARLGILADELIFQKRISILQMILILVCLGLVLFSRASFNQYMEMPVVQRVLSRSPSTRWLNVASGDTPTQSPPPTRDGSFQKRHGILKGHRRMASEDSIEDSFSPQEIYSPPTPNSAGYASDGEPTKDESKMEDPEFDPSSIERPSTSPPILPSSFSSSTPELNDVPESIDSRLSPETEVAVPQVIVEQATPPPKHLTWSLPDS